MVLRLLSRGLLIGGALYAGLVTSAAAQEHVPVTFTSDGRGGEACSGPLAGQQFDSLAAAIAAAEAVTGTPYCYDANTPYFCGDRITQNVNRDWKWTQRNGRWEYWMVFRTWQTPTCSGGVWQAHTYAVWRPLSCGPDPDLCDPPACAQFAGVEIGRFYTGNETQAQVCANPPASEINECAATVVGAPFCNGGFCYGTLRFTGAGCTDEPPVGEDDQIMVPPSNNNCITSGTVSVCFSKSDKNCGLVNGEPWCASAMPSNGCVSTESGAVVCTVDAWSAPTKPDGETPAEPDGVFVVGAEDGGRTYEYFRRETVASSGRPVVVGGPGAGGTGAEGPGEADFEAELGELPTFSEEYLDAEGALARAWNAVLSSESVQAWLALGDGLTSMEDCPRPQFELWNRTYVIESHCELAEQVRAELDLVFGFAWTLLAVMIVGKA